VVNLLFFFLFIISFLGYKILTTWFFATSPIGHVAINCAAICYLEGRDVMGRSSPKIEIEVSFLLLFFKF
jgi:hypothetical protein